jgi:hypothetical protein
MRGALLNSITGARSCTQPSQVGYRLHRAKPGADPGAVAAATHRQTNGPCFYRVCSLGSKTGRQRTMTTQNRLGGSLVLKSYSSPSRGWALSGLPSFRYTAQGKVISTMPQLVTRTWVRAGETRRKYVPVGSTPASMPPTVPPTRTHAPRRGRSRVSMLIT